VFLFANFERLGKTKDLGATSSLMSHGFAARGQHFPASGAV
jgi:hypothetical protein